MKDACSVLIIDDHVIFAESLCKTLKSIPWISQTEGMSSALDALSRLESTTYDVVLLDLEMPEMTGLKFLSELQKRKAEVPIIILSTHERYDFVKKAYDLGAQGYVLKTGSISELRGAIETVLKGGVYFTPRIQSIILSEVATENQLKKNLPILSSRELEVLSLICQQKSGKEIADALCIALPTVNSHRANLLKKTKCINMAGLVRYAYANGLYSE